MKVTHVIRGEDHLSNTPKHILLLEAMGLEAPQYGHLPLIHGPGGEPLSKRLESVSVREFRRKGYLPHALANYMALLGWSPGDNREIFTWKELQQVFDLARVGKSASIYDPHKLDWVNGEHLRALTDEEFCRAALAYLKEQKLLKHDETAVHKILPVFKDNIERFEQLPDRLKILDDDFSYENQALLASAEAREIFEAGIAILNEVGADLKPAPPLEFEPFMDTLKKRVKAKGKNLFMPLRVALTGAEHGPELKRIFPVFGTERVRERFERALKVN
jgi:glutamyl/glutaminyl-tRNA synthetase